MRQPVLLIVNGLPSAGKTTLARRLAADLALPVFSRDAIHETLYDALGTQGEVVSPALGSAAFALLYTSAGTVLAAGQPVIIEAYFGRAALRTAELARLRETRVFTPFQIVCAADGRVLLRRFLARAGSSERHRSHRDLEWLAENKELLLSGHLAPLALDGALVEIDTTTPFSFEYVRLLQAARAALAS
ncbi:MAG TPA: AAA family ATPase [Ktedonobacterales bacterium]